MQNTINNMNDDINSIEKYMFYSYVITNMTGIKQYLCELYFMNNTNIYTNSYMYAYSKNSNKKLLEK